MARRTSGSNPTQGKFGSRTKDKVELLLWRKVCVDKTMTLDQTKTALSEALDEASSAEMKKRLAFSPKVRFGLNASCRAHALPPELFQATFKPRCLLFCGRLIYGLWLLAEHELLAATLTPERSHLLEPCRILGATLFYC